MPRKAKVTTAKGIEFLKQTLAEKLREQIIQGHLAPGQRIVEAFWAQRFGVAQTSVREAINLLIADGFVTKASGRSARVTNYSAEDVAQVYELRGALEGLAARLATERRADLTRLRESVDAMEKAIRHGQIRRLLEADLDFHLRLCELSGNRTLFTQARGLLVPLFAFVAMRAARARQQAGAWEADLVRHSRMVDVIGEGDAAAAEFLVRATLIRFAQRAGEIWETEKPGQRKAARSSRSS